MTTRTATRKALIATVLTAAVLGAPVDLPVAVARTAPPDTPYTVTSSHIATSEHPSAVGNGSRSLREDVSGRLAHTQSALETSDQGQSSLQHSRLADIAAEMNREDSRDWPEPQTSPRSGTTCP